MQAKPTLAIADFSQVLKSRREERKRFKREKKQRLGMRKKGWREEDYLWRNLEKGISGSGCNLNKITGPEM